MSHVLLIKSENSAISLLWSLDFFLGLPTAMFAERPHFSLVMPTASTDIQTHKFSLRAGQRPDSDKTVVFGPSKLQLHDHTKAPQQTAFGKDGGWP